MLQHLNRGPIATGKHQDVLPDYNAVCALPEEQKQGSANLDIQVQTPVWGEWRSSHEILEKDFSMRAAAPGILCEDQARTGATLHVRHPLFLYPAIFIFKYYYNCYRAICCNFHNIQNLCCTLINLIRVWTKGTMASAGTRRTWQQHQWQCTKTWKLGTCINSMNLLRLTVLSIKSGSARSRTELRIRWSLLCKPWKEVA